MVKSSPWVYESLWNNGKRLRLGCRNPSSVPKVFTTWPTFFGTETRVQVCELILSTAKRAIKMREPYDFLSPDVGGTGRRKTKKKGGKVPVPFAKKSRAPLDRRKIVLRCNVYALTLGVDAFLREIRPFYDRFWKTQNNLGQIIQGCSMNDHKKEWKEKRKRKKIC